MYTPTIFCDASFLNIRACVNSVYQAFPLSRGRSGNEASTPEDPPDLHLGCVLKVLQISYKLRQVLFDHNLLACCTDSLFVMLM